MKIISIDPDVRKSGYSEYRNGTLTCCTSMYIWTLFEELKIPCDLVIIEDSRLNRCSSWHAGGRGAVRNVGKNQAVCVILEDFCKFHGIKYQLVKPNGYSNMFADEKNFQATTGYKQKTNMDARASAAIGWGMRNLTKI